jgi:hypothetical protein
MKATERQRVKTRSLAHNTLRMEEHVRALKWELERLTSKSITHTDMYKRNNKLVDA